MSLVQSKAGLQMVETIIRYLPKIVVCLEKIAEEATVHKYRDDIIHILEDMDIRKQENINLNHRIKELETMLKGYQPRYE